MPPLKTRVVYRRVTLAGETRTCTGTVTAHYPGGERCWDQPLPKWWPYTDAVFAPSIEELEVAK